LNKAELVLADASKDLGPPEGKCCAMPGSTIKGTYFFGGAGMDGNYIEPLVRALREAGIKSATYVSKDKWSAGTAMDAAIGSIIGREYDRQFPMLIRTSNVSSQQFNLIGYSYGSIVAAQLAAKYASKGTPIDNLVLIGSPLSKNFVLFLKNLMYLKKLVIINLDKQGDPIYAGMSVIELFSKLPLLASQMPESKGHFYYANPTEVGNKRRKNLAEELFKIGLR
jgi:hypothetical protein